MSIKSVYIAGPGVFFSDAEEHRDRKIELCSAHGFKGLSPLDYELTGCPHNPLEFSKEIFKANITLMAQADAVIADLTPFRGASADAGTVFEVGYMKSQGKITFGYSNTNEDYQSRVEHTDLLDINAHRVENFGLEDNLMIIHACDFFVSKTTQKPFLDIGGFEECLIKLKNF